MGATITFNDCRYRNGMEQLAVISVFSRVLNFTIKYDVSRRILSMSMGPSTWALWLLVWLTI